MKPISNVISVILVTGLLLGGKLLPNVANTAGAQSTEPPPASTQTEPSPPASSAASPEGVLAQQPRPQNVTNGAIPIWIWLILGVLGLWNVALSVLFWLNLKDSSTNHSKTRQKLAKLEGKDTELYQRITRKFDDLKSQIDAQKKALETLQLQVQAKSTKADDYSFETKRGTPQYGTYGKNEPYVGLSHGYSPRQSYSRPPDPKASEPWESIVQNYNHSPQILEDYVVERVSESEESIASRRGNSNAPVSLKSASNYSYWIFVGEDSNYWLTPKNDLKITGMNFDTLQALFECPEYQQGSRVQVIKPAKVTQNAALSSWDLVEKGQLTFIR